MDRQCHACKTYYGPFQDVQVHGKTYYRCRLCAAPTAQGYIYHKTFPTETQRIIGSIMAHINYVAHEMIARLPASETQQMAEAMVFPPPPLKEMGLDLEKELNLISEERRASQELEEQLRLASHSTDRADP